MNRTAFKMKLKPGYHLEYKKRHDAIWPELKALLKEAGIYDYTIFLDEETNTLFAFQRTTGAGGSQDLGQHDLVKKWWNYMADIMEVNPDSSPISKPLLEVFHID